MLMRSRAVAPAAREAYDKIAKEVTVQARAWGIDAPLDTPLQICEFLRASDRPVEEGFAADLATWEKAVALKTALAKLSRPDSVEFTLLSMKLVEVLGLPEAVQKKLLADPTGYVAFLKTTALAAQDGRPEVKELALARDSLLQKTAKIHGFALESDEDHEEAPVPMDLDRVSVRPEMMPYPAEPMDMPMPVDQPGPFNGPFEMPMKPMPFEMPMDRPMPFEMPMGKPMPYEMPMDKPMPYEMPMGMPPMPFGMPPKEPFPHHHRREEVWVAAVSDDEHFGHHRHHHHGKEAFEGHRHHHHGKEAFEGHRHHHHGEEEFEGHRHHHHGEEEFEGHHPSTHHHHGFFHNMFHGDHHKHHHGPHYFSPTTGEELFTRHEIMHKNHKMACAMTLAVVTLFVLNIVQCCRNKRLRRQLNALQNPKTPSGEVLRVVDPEQSRVDPRVAAVRLRAYQEV
jgi:hypothetical protein